MARSRRTSIETFVDLYIEMEPDERALALAALRGADRVLSRGKRAAVTTASQDAFENLGADIAEGQ